MNAQNHTADPEEIARIKEFVTEFFEVAHGPVAGLSRLDEFIADDYVQHNPNAGEGREGLREFFTYMQSLPPEERLDPAKERAVNLVVDGEFVVRQALREDGMLVDIFRLQNGMLQEHWDAFRPAPGAKVIHGME